MTLERLEKKFPEEDAEIEFYKRLIRKNPQKVHILDFLAYAFFKQAEYIEAIHCWKKLLEKKVIKEEFRITAKIAHAYEMLGEFEHAYHYFSLAKETTTKNIEIIGKFGETAYLIENYEDAIEAFEFLSEEEPYNEIAWHNLALAYYNIGKHERAIECLKVSLELDESASESYYTLATIYAENYLLDDALEALEKALIIDPDLALKAKTEESFYSLSDSSLFKYMIFG